jgi:hypothetical protein
VAKESADIILLEKSLPVLQDGVIEGRAVFGNAIKYLRMAGSSNFGNMFSMIGASALLPFLPMAPVQILANNDVSQTRSRRTRSTRSGSPGRAAGTSAASAATWSRSARCPRCSIT